MVDSGGVVEAVPLKVVEADQSPCPGTSMPDAHTETQRPAPGHRCRKTTPIAFGMFARHRSSDYDARG